MKYFTDSPYERMMMEIPRPQKEPPKKAAPASARATENPHRTAGKRCLTEEIPSFFLSKL